MYGWRGWAYSSPTSATSDHLAEVHDPDPVADVLDDRQVVGDEQVRQVEPLAQVEQQVEDLRLDRDVEGGHRLVGEDELGVEGERPRDPDPLALAAGELVRVAAGVLAPQADLLEVVADALVADLAVAPVVLGGRLGQQPLADEVADGHARVQRADRILEDDLHPAAHVFLSTPCELRIVLAVELRAAGGRLLEAEQRAAERRLAAAGLADEAEDLAPADLERDVVDGPDVADDPAEDARPDRVVGLEVLDRRACLPPPCRPLLARRPGVGASLRPVRRSRPSCGCLRTSRAS